MNLYEAHHAFYGLILMAAGFAGIFYGWSLWLVLAAVLFGWWVFADDVYQHLRQRSEPGYLSPLHVWFYRIVRWLK